MEVNHVLEIINVERAVGMEYRREFGSFWEQFNSESDDGDEQLELMPFDEGGLHCLLPAVPHRAGHIQAIIDD